MVSTCPAGDNPGPFFEGSELEFHPIANVFPLMEGEEFRELAQDIEKNGQQQPILTFEDKILDGRNRYRACLEAGEEPWVERWQGDSPVEAVLSLNLHRRHLSSSQRAMIAERMLEHLEEEAKKRRAATLKQNASVPEKMPERETGQKVPEKSPEVPESRGQPLGNSLPNEESADDRKSVSQAAKLTGTNRQYVSDAKKLRQEAPEQAERVERGEMSISAAKKERQAKTKREPEKSPEPTASDALPDDFSPPPSKLSSEQNAFYDISKYLVRLRRMEPETVAEEWLERKDEFEAEMQQKDARYVVDWFSRYDAAIERLKKQHRREAGNLRAVGEEER